jgi:hypothetical protein
MENSHALFVLAALSTASMAPAQQTIVHLPWTWDLAAGTRAQNYPQAQDALDIWAVEDFSISGDWFLDQFSCSGSGTTGSATAAATLDVVVQIWDGLPPNGQIVLTSTPGSGHCVDGTGGGGWDLFTSPFGGQRLRSGQYWVVWQADLLPSLAPAVMFSQPGPYAVGTGQSGSSWRYWPNQSGRLELIRTNIDGTGDGIGTNFRLTGDRACVADMNDDRGVTIDDLLTFLALFEEGVTRADVDDGSMTGRRDLGVTVDDLLFFLARFEAGC